jgi:hypothetical protein
LPPALVGVNVTDTVQFSPTASVAPQVVVLANCLASLPVSVIALAPLPVNTRSAVPVLLMVIDCAALATLVRWLPNVRLVGPTPMIGAVPVPVSDTVLGLPVALCPMLIAALLAPVEVGVNVTLTVQLDPGSRDAPQVVVLANWLASLPVRMIALAPLPVNTRSAVPVLRIVTVCPPLVVPTS